MSSWIVIDGPAAAGCTTIAQAVADRTSGVAIRTGALYRALTYALLVELDPEDDTLVAYDEATIAKLARNWRNRVFIDPDSGEVWLDGQDISQAIRSAPVTRSVSYISSIAKVRRGIVVPWTRRQAHMATGLDRVAISEGRSEYWEHAGNYDLAFFIDADPRVRAQRRGREIELDVTNYAALNGLMLELIERDFQNCTRTESPLRPADVENQFHIRLYPGTLVWQKSPRKLAQMCRCNPATQIHIDTTNIAVNVAADLITGVATEMRRG